jgi:hypothetical protein
VLVLSLTGSEIALEEIYQDEHNSAVVGAAWKPGTPTFATIDRTGGLFFWSD